MNKLLFYIPVAFIIYGLGYYVAMKEFKPPVEVWYTDEMPGLGADNNHPDTALAFYVPNMGVRLERISLPNNLPDPKIKVIDWPEEFSPILHQTGEINSPMSFRISGDTLKIEFARD